MAILSSHLEAIRTRAGRLTAAAVLPAALLMSGCGAATHRPRVASLPDPGHVSHRTTTTAGVNEGVPDPSGRPRLGLDQNSYRQLEILYDPYYHCVYNEHRVPPKSDGAAYTSALRHAVAACIRLDPLPPWPLDPANPQSRAFIGRTVSCMRGRGYQATAVLDPGYIINAPEWTVTYQPGIDNVSQRVAAIQYRCQDQVERQMADG